jgi:hypothetical protein
VTFERPTSTVQPGPAAAPRVAASTPNGGSPGSIERLVFTPAAAAWPDGGAPLARWLRSNPEALGDLLGTTYTASDQELPGVDGIVLRDPDGHPVLVTVELGASSEQRFGALLTHMTASQAHTAVWIVGAPRPDHLAAMSWLNRATDASFYVVRLRAARIGSSPPAPILELVLRSPRAADPNGPADPASNGGRRAGDWRDIALGEETATADPTSG